MRRGLFSTGILLFLLSTLMPALARSSLYGASVLPERADSLERAERSPATDTAAPLFPSSTRAPAVRVGTYFDWMILVATLGIRVQVEPIRDVLGIWGTLGWAPYPVAPEEHPTPSELDLAVGFRLQPLPFGILNRLYLDAGKKWYWDLDLWRVGMGWKVMPGLSRMNITVGLAYEWGDDHRDIAMPDDQWSFPWIVFGVEYGFGL